jgi:4-hydroxythreonine-4-phosphate dehydrogenase
MIARLAITPGDPAGIGPDIVIKTARQPQAADLVVFADPELLLARADTLKLPLHIVRYDPGQQPALLPANTLRVCSVTLKTPAVAGHPDKGNAAYVLETIDLATTACLEQHCDGLVTGPVHKGLMNEAGFMFTGHTEYLADYTHSDHVVMMLATEGLRVALATTHLPLKAVSAAITADSLEKTIGILHRDLQRYFCPEAPVIFVCGLNPHAGDQGALGDEEINIIIPVLNKLRAQQVNVLGPYPADTIFSPDNLARADVFLAMYHDQGLPVLKYKGFSNAINVTLGLNIIRTSVDHGTAFNLAGTGKVDTHSLALAITTAINMIDRKKRVKRS